MSGTFLAAQLLFALLFIGSGVAHITQADAMTQYAHAKGVPQARLATVVSAVWITIGGFSWHSACGDAGALMLTAVLCRPRS